MRRTGEIVAHGNRGVVPQKNRAGVLNLVEHLFRVAGRDVQVFGRQQVCQFGRLCGVTSEDQCAVLVQTGQSQVAARQFCQLDRQLVPNGFDQRGVPCDQDSRSRTVFRLRNQIRSNEPGVGRIVGQQHHFTGSGDAVDVDFAEDVLLGQGDKQIAWSDDLVHARQPFHTVGHRRDRLSTPDTVHLGDPDFGTSRQERRVVAAKVRRRNHHGDFFDSSNLGRNSGHQYCRRICRRTAGHTDADALQWQVPLPQFDSIGSVLADQSHVFMQDSALKFRDVADDRSQSPQEFRVGRGMGCRKFLGRDAHGFLR